jgi:hypothetical protein
VWLQYSANRKGEHPQRHLRHWRGILQADAFAGYNALYEDGGIIEAACWSHARRKFWDIHERQHRLPGTLAHQALERIGRLFAIEADIRGRPPDERYAVRQERTRIELDALKAWAKRRIWLATAITSPNPSPRNSIAFAEMRTREGRRGRHLIGLATAFSKAWTSGSVTYAFGKPLTSNPYRVHPTNLGVGAKSLRWANRSTGADPLALNCFPKVNAFTSSTLRT